MTLHLFNPENDLALALGCRHYTPPPHVEALRRAGAMMPSLWAAPGDAIIAPEAAPFDPVAVSRCEPWGWSLDARRRFLGAGVSEDILPTEQAVERMRQLSHRRSSIELLTLIGCSDLAAKELTTSDAVVDAVGRDPGLWLKTPWSCSGRGVMQAGVLSREALRRRVEGIIHRQGSVMVEKGLTGKRLDFAALFTARRGGDVRFEGWSVFRSEPRGVYGGNVVAAQEQLLAMILDSGVDPRPAVSQLVGALSKLIGGDYDGPLGIDMMAHAEGLHPCIELNLRRTMGHVALSLASRRGGDSEPRLLAWHRDEEGKPSSDAEPILPPAFGFSLSLSKL